LLVRRLATKHSAYSFSPFGLRVNLFFKLPKAMAAQQLNLKGYYLILKRIYTQFRVYNYGGDEGHVYMNLEVKNLY